MNFNNIRSAKQLTFVYFAGLAFAIIVFHFSLFNSTLEDLEALNAKNRLNKDLQLALPALDLGTKSLTVSPYSSVFVGLESLPENVSLPDPLELNTLYEIDDYDSRYYDFFIMKTKRQVMGKMQDIYLLHYDDVYELSEEQMFQTQYKQMLFSLILLGISLFIILKVSDRLTSPLSKLSKELKQRSVNHFEPLSLPDGGATKEIWQLTSRINEYQEKIKRLVEKERAFTRYASHELRSPLMVMKGAISLL
ncbi:MAG: sensor histidine kinase, partial [Kangiellaceae bacterium]